MEKSDSHSRFLKNCMSDALISLMKQKPFSDISITELCGKAGVSRMAFYRNYSCKEDILNDYMDEVFNNYSKILLDLDEINMYIVSLEYFKLGKRHKQFIQQIVNAKMDLLLLDKLNRDLDILYKRLSRPPNLNYNKYERSFIAGGLSKILIDWVNDDCVVSPEQMGNYVITFLRTEIC